MRKKGKLKKAIQNIIFIFSAQREAYPLLFVFAVVSGILRCLFMAVQIIFPKRIVDSLIGESGEGLWILIGGYAAATVFFVYLSSIITRLEQKSSYYLPHEWLLRLSQKMTRIDCADVESREFNEAYLNAENAAFKLTSKGDEVVRLLFSAVMELVMLVAIVSTLDVWAVLIVAACAVCQILLDSRANNAELHYRKSVSAPLNHRNYVVCVLLGYFPGIKDIMTFEGQDLFLSKLRRANRECQEKYRIKQVSQRRVRCLQYLLKAAELAVIYFLMAKKFHSGALSAGSLVMYVSAAGELKGVLNIILAAVLSVGEAEIYMGQYNDIMNRPEKMRSARKTYRRLSDLLKEGEAPRIEFCNVSFRYAPDLDDVIKNVSFVLEPGEKLVLVGENGAGKSTLVKLLTRLYDVTEGCITVNGVDIREFDCEEYQRMFAAVFQDYQLFDCSVRENVGFDHADAEKVQDILCEIGLSESKDILERKLSSEGGSLSGGERQMVAIGRAIYKGAIVSVFDEVTSAIDPLRESAIYKRIMESGKGKSIVYISHRLSVCTSCDRIILLSEGEVAENGTHSELMAMNGVYAEMFRRQAEGYR